MQLNELYEKINAIKEKIEKEMKEINKLYDKTFSEVTKSYEIKHEKLLKEENDLKDKLQTEVTKIKEILEAKSNITRVCKSTYTQIVTISIVLMSF